VRGELAGKVSARGVPQKLKIGEGANIGERRNTRQAFRAGTPVAHQIVAVR
jgi:hypothetical protein